MIELLVDRLTEFDCKSGKALRFNLMQVVTGSSGQHYCFCVLGFRLWGGAIWPPQTPARGSYYDIGYLSENLALLLYSALESKLAETPFGAKHKLQADKTKAIQRLLMSGREAIYFPSLTVDGINEMGNVASTSVE